MNKRQKGLLVIFFVYSIAFIAALLVGLIFHYLHPIFIVLLSDVSATLVVYIFSLIYKNTSIYDPYWFVVPLFISVYYFLFSPFSVCIVRKIVVVGLTAIWSIKSTWHWARRWHGLEDEDFRYELYRNNYKKLFGLINLFGLQLMPTIAVYLASLSFYPAIFIEGLSFNAIDIIAIIITSIAIIIEGVADQQFYTFLQKRKGSGEIMKDGLWKYSRHPNYFGEILFWFGLYFFALAADISFWWTIIGPVFILLLFNFVSIPLMDKRSLKRRPNYADHMEKVSKLLLLPTNDDT